MIKTIKIVEVKTNLNGMARDYFQRENLSKGLTNAASDDLVLISDLDEIPNLGELDLNKIKNEIIVFKQKIFFYKLNLLYDKFDWFGSKACRKKLFITSVVEKCQIEKISWMESRFSFFQEKYSNIFHVQNGGWHFTCLKNLKNWKKLLNFAHHYEFEQSGLNLNDIKKMISENKAVYDYGADMKKINGLEI